MKFQRIIKKTNKVLLVLILSVTCVFNSISIPVHASNTEKPSVWEELGDAFKEIGKNSLLQIVRSGSFSAGAALMDGMFPGSGAVGSTILGGLANGTVDWYENATSGDSATASNGDTYNYYYNKGIPTSYNSTTYNQTQSHSIFNTQKTENNTYNYRWYNPVTHNYDITNTYTYNTEYNTYNYTTYNIVNNYNYTTNYYIQDNRTYVSYYIINTNEDTGQKDETYIELYYQLPDGRNSYNLTADEVKGTYFTSDYTKYISVAEDDGTTLGLWHLDSDLKDSSYWNNTAGNAYNNKYTEGLYTSGKIFSENENDFLELKLDKVSLPDTYTLEWCEYIPESSYVPEVIQPKLYTTYDGQVLFTEDSNNNCYFTGDINLMKYSYYINNFVSVEGDSKFYETSSGSFVPYALVKSGSNYKFYRNGLLIDSFAFDEDSFNRCGVKGQGISITSSSIKFNVINNKKIGTFTSDTWVAAGNKWGNVDYVHPQYNYYLTAHKNAIIDEVRLSKGALYTGDSYTPSSQPYTTNTVLTVPKTPKDNEIAFRTNTNLGDVRFGGARQTYPSNGSIYVALDDKQKVEGVQQYQEDGWYEIESSIYFYGEWTLLKGFDLSQLTIKDDDTGNPDNPDNPGPDNPDNPATPSNPDNPGNDDGTGLLETIGKFLGSLVKGLSALVAPLIEGISSLVESITNAISSITSLLSGSFADFLASAFRFIPKDIVNVVALGVSLIVLATVFKILKG